MGQRHHLVPRFYLQRWSVSGRGLTAIRRSTGEVLQTSAKAVAVETDAYAIEVPNTAKSYVFEQLLSSVESEAAMALRNMLTSWPPSQKDRESWSLLMALQVTRGVDFRENQNTLAEYMLKTQVALSSRDPAAMRARLEDAGLEPTEANMDIMRGMMDDPDSYHLKMHPAHVLKAAMEMAIEIIRYLVLRHWGLAILDAPLLMTCDHPLSLYSKPENRAPFGGIGLMTADEICMPLDPSALLVMTHPDPATEPVVGGLPMERVQETNQRIAWECDEWVVAHPDNPQAETIAAWLKGQPAPRLTIEGPTPTEWAESGRRMQRASDSDPPVRGEDETPEDP